MKFLSSPLCPLADVAKGGDGEESASCDIPVFGCGFAALVISV